MNAPVVVGFDGSAASDARRHDAEVVIVSHDPVRTDTGPDVVREQAEALGRRYSDVKYRHESAGGDTAATALIDTAARLDAAMIVVGSRGRGGFRALIAGSTSRALLEHADRSVTVVPAGSARAGEEEETR